MKTKQYLAIDIGGTSVKLGIVDETGAVLAKAEESVSFDGYETPILTTVCKAAKAFVEAQGLSPAAQNGKQHAAPQQPRKDPAHNHGPSLPRTAYAHRHSFIRKKPPPHACGDGFCRSGW